MFLITLFTKMGWFYCVNRASSGSSTNLKVYIRLCICWWVARERFSYRYLYTGCADRPGRTWMTCRINWYWAHMVHCLLQCMQCNNIIQYNIIICSETYIAWRHLVRRLQIIALIWVWAPQTFCTTTYNNKCLLHFVFFL